VIRTIVAFGLAAAWVACGGRAAREEEHLTNSQVLLKELVFFNDATHVPFRAETLSPRNFDSGAGFVGRTNLE
jgi:hypothetical protein